MKENSKIYFLTFHSIFKIYLLCMNQKAVFLWEKNDIVLLFTFHGTGLAPKTWKGLSSVKIKRPRNSLPADWRPSRHVTQILNCGWLCLLCCCTAIKANERLICNKTAMCFSFNMRGLTPNFLPTCCRWIGVYFVRRTDWYTIVKMSIQEKSLCVQRLLWLPLDYYQPAR